MKLSVIHKSWKSSVAFFDLVAANDEPLPPWEPGSHISIEVPSERGMLVRHFSLIPTGSPKLWRIAALREINGRGGSIALCDDIHNGAILDVEGPVNLFPFKPPSGKKITFIAAGIGIAPILSMVQTAESHGLDWRLLYLCRHPKGFFFKEDLSNLPEHRKQLHCSGNDGRFDLAKFCSTLSDGELVYACGPQRLLDDLAANNKDQSTVWSLKMERFENPHKSNRDSDSEFEVTLARSGKTFSVKSNETILDVLRQNSIDVPSSCREGLCATCEQRVLEGIPDHRDAILTPKERSENTHMIICVSRSNSKSLVLDL